MSAFVDIFVAEDTVQFLAYGRGKIRAILKGSSQNDLIPRFFYYVKGLYIGDPVLFRWINYG